MEGVVNHSLPNVAQIREQIEDAKSDLFWWLQHGAEEGRSAAEIQDNTGMIRAKIASLESKLYTPEAPKTVCPPVRNPGAMRNSVELERGVSYSPQSPETEAYLKAWYDTPGRYTGD